MIILNMYKHDYGGLNLFWWFIWVILLFWIFAIPYDIPGQRKKKDSPLDILKKRLATGEITKDVYLEHKNLLEKY